MCKIGSSLSWYLGSCIHKTLARSTSMMDVTFIIDTIGIGCVFSGILVLMCSRLCEIL